MPNLKVEDLMTDEVYSINLSEDVASLADLMSDLNIRHVPVVHPDGDIVGIVSHRDLMRSLTGAESELPIGELRDFLKSIQVSEITNKEAITVDLDTDIAEAASLMLENKMGCLPVVDNEKLVGILTEADFVRLVAQYADEPDLRQISERSGSML